VWTLQRRWRSFTPAGNRTPFVSVIKSRAVRWVGHVAHMGAMKNEKLFYLETLKRRDRLVSEMDPEGTGCSYSGYMSRPLSSCCEHGDEPYQER
jgi:hypothetical protein